MFTMKQSGFYKMIQVFTLFLRNGMKNGQQR